MRDKDRLGPLVAPLGGRWRDSGRSWVDFVSLWADLVRLWDDLGGFVEALGCWCEPGPRGGSDNF